MGNMKSSTETLIGALRILANEIQSEDGVANAAIAEAADRMEELCAERDEAVRSCHIWQKGHSDIVTERDLWQQEAKRWKTISQTQTTQHYAHPN
jgi:hypothetical protein